MPLIENSSKVFTSFALSSGSAIPVRQAYQLTRPNGPVRRRVLLCHGITSSHQAWLPQGQERLCADAGWGNGFIGPGKALDPDQGDMILCINVLGSWFGSTGAGDDAQSPFPAVTMSDMATAQWRLIDELGINKLDQVIGYSFGGYLGVEMASQQSARVGALLQLASAFRGRADPQGVATIETMMGLPPPERRRATHAWRYALLERYGYVRWLRDHSGACADQRLNAEIDAWVDTVSLEALLTLRAAAAGFDRTQTQLPLPVTAIRWDSDPLFPAWQQSEAPPYPALTLPSPYGHFAPLAQPEDWTPYLIPVRPASGA
jgi:homoserine O-acetyltransferase